MRCVTYAGETIMTTDEVAEVLVNLTAALAREGEADAVRIPIVEQESGELGHAELVIGVGNDVLSVPTEWDGDVPDFSAAVAELKSNRAFPRRVEEDEDGPIALAGPGWDVDLDGLGEA